MSPFQSPPEPGDTSPVPSAVPAQDRYHRQTLLQQVGVQGQERLSRAHALIVGCGALGTVASEMLARAGVGALTIVDRDVVEWTNLQRQCLYDEADAREGLPKAEAARRRLAQINGQVRVRAIVEDFTARNAARIALDEQLENFPAGVDVIIDGTDNFETRYLINDLAVQRGIPYIYGAAVGTAGMLMPILPQRAIERMGADVEPTPCLRCLFEDPPAPGSPTAGETCDTIGVLGPVVATIANMQAVEALKILLARMDALSRALTTIDLWKGELHQMNVARARRDDCPCCALGRYDFLEASSAAGSATTLCGRNSIQISSGSRDSHSPGRVDLDALARRLAPHGDFAATRFLLRGEFRAELSESGASISLTVFPDGRALFTGITQPQRARALYARYIGA